MPKSSSGRSKNDSDRRFERRDTDDGDTKRSRADSGGDRSSRRKSSGRDDETHDGEFLPSSTSYSSTSRSPYAGVAAPSVASSFVSAQTNSDGTVRPPELMRNESMADTTESRRDRESRRESRSEKKSDRQWVVDGNDDSSRNVGDDRERRDSRKSSRSDKREKSRAYSDHDAALPHNQFPGQEPAQYTEPYYPPGRPGEAASYYANGGPGTRSDAPNTDQAALMLSSNGSSRAPEPNSSGRTGAAAAYYGPAGYEDSSTPSKPGKKPRRKSDKQDGRDVDDRAVSSTARAGEGAAAAYFSGAPMIAGPAQAPYHTDSPQSYAGSSRPLEQPYGSGQNSSGVYAAAAAGLAGAAAGGYMANNQYSQYSHPPSYHSQPDPNFRLGQNSSAFPQMQYQYRQKRRSPFGKLSNWFKDPEGVAQFEQYSQAVGVCKYCFDPNSSPMDAPRKHHYHGRRNSPRSRYDSSGRVEKSYRYSSSSDDERKRKSSAGKVLAGGLAGIGAAKVGQAMYDRRHDFDDTYSVKTGQPYSTRPENRSRVSFQEEISTTSRGVNFSKEDSRERRSEKKGRSGESSNGKRRSRRRSSSSSNSSNGISKVTALGLGAAGVAAGAALVGRRRSRSRSPSKRKGYYSKRISPKHSYVDLNDTTAGSVGFNQFWSPSQNEKKGKRVKSLFNFSNSSGSSSDADLAFGSGTVRRKDSRKFRRDDGKEFNMGTAAALTAAGMALASESDSRGKGKSSKYANVYRNDRDNRSGGKNKIRLQDHETTTDADNDDGWIDTDGEHGGSSGEEDRRKYDRRAAASQSRESVVEEGGWWPWSTPSKVPKERRGKDSVPDTPSRTDPLAAAAIGAGVGAVAANMMSDRNTSRRYADPTPPMREIDPVPTSEAMMSGAVRPSRTASGQYFSARDEVPLQQPQPVMPLPTVAGALDDSTRNERRVSEQDYETRRRRRRDSSPAKLPSRTSQVSFDVPESKRQDTPREDSQERKRLEKKDRRRTLDFSEIANDDEKRAAREAEIEAELQKLYDEDRRRAAEKAEKKRDKRSKSGDVAAAVATAAAVGAGVAAVSSMSKKSRESSSERERKPSLKKSKDRDEPPATESQQERIARMAAQRVRSVSPTVVPTVEHESYGDYFLPKELAENVKEHNAESAARNENHEHEVVEIVPGGDKSGPFEKFNYAIFGTEPQHDPFDHPWAVPTLSLLEPTPPVSRVPSRSASPVVRSPAASPVKDKELPDEKEIGEPLERKGSKVTWGDHDTYVYEVVTPEYERSSYMPDSPEEDRPSNAVRNAVAAAAAAAAAAAMSKSKSRDRKPSKLNRVQTVPDDDQDASRKSDRGIPPVEEMTREQREHLAKGKDFADLPGTFDTSSKDGPPSDRYKDDKRRVSAEPRDQDHRTDVVEIEPRVSKSERRRMERAASLEDQTQYVPTAKTPDKDASTGAVFDYLVDENGKPLPPSSALEYQDSSVSSRAPAERERVRPTADEGFSKPKRASTFGDDYKDKKKGSRSRSGYSSDPEDRERSRSRSRNGDKRSAKSDIGLGATAAVAANAAAASLAAIAAHDEETQPKDKKSKRRSKREDEIFNDDDVASVVSSPATKDDDKKARRRSKRDSEIFDDDDDRSVASSPADSSSRKKSKDKKDDKRSSGGIWSNIFGGAKSDVSTSSKKSSKSSKSDGKADRDEGDDKQKKRHSKSGDADISEPSRTGRRDDDSRYSASRDQSTDNGFVSADEHTAEPSSYDTEEPSFLAERPDMPLTRPMDSPMATTEDGVSGLTVTTEREASPETSSDDIMSATQTPSSTRARRISALRTSELGNVPSIASPTAVPITFRRPPGSPATQRAFFSSPIASPQSPLTTPRTRQGRPKSTEFRSTEFRPLYLVEKSRSEKTPVQEVEENLPSLPSSRASSAHPSFEDLRTAAEEQDNLAQDTGTPGRTRRYSASWWEDENTKRRQSPDYLDSRAATPVPESVQRQRDATQREQRGRERPADRPVPKYEFHSPSELLADPATIAGMIGEHVPEDVPRASSPLPSVASTDEFMSAIEGTPSERSWPRSRSTSRSRSRSRPRSRRDTITAAGIGLGIGAAAAAVGELLSRDERQRVRDRDVVEQEDMYGGGLHDPVPEASRSTAYDEVREPELSGELSQDAPPDNSATTTEHDEWALPASRKKSKNDKKRAKGKVDAWDVEPTPTEPAEIDNTAAPIVEPVPVGEAEWDFPTTGKKGKKAKKNRQAPPALDIAKAEARSDDAQRVYPGEDDEPLTAVPSLPSDGQLTARPFDDHHLFPQVTPEDPLATTPIPSDEPDTLEEFRDRDAFPFDARPARSTDVPAEESSSATFVPAIEALNKPTNELGAFEAAFERAVRARGLSDASSREEALDAFLPMRNNAPFVAGADVLGGIGEESGGSATPVSDDDGVKQKVDLDAGEDWGFATAKKDKKGKKEKRKSKLRESLGVDEVAPVEAEDTIAPIGNESRDLESTPVSDALETPIEVEEPAWAVPAALKKDKKKKKKQARQDFDYEEAPTPIEGIQPSYTEEVREASDLPTPIEAENAWDVPASSSKKDKKSKKKQARETFDLEDVPTPTEEAPTSFDEPLGGAATVVVTAPTEENEWDTPSSSSKKGKKSKKDKKKSFSDWTDDAVPVAASAAVLGGAAAVAGIALADHNDEKSLHDRDILSHDAAAPAQMDLRDDVPVDDAAPFALAEKEREPDSALSDPSAKVVEEDEWAVPMKKSKKDKKKAKRQSIVDFDEPATSSAPTDVADPAALVEPETPAPLNATRDNAADSFVEATAETQPEKTPAQEADEFSWAPSSFKKSKKDKKKRKSVTFADDDSVSVTPQDDDLPAESNLLVDRTTVEEPSQLDLAQDEINAQAIAEGQAEIEKQAISDADVDLQDQAPSTEQVESARAQMFETVQHDPGQGVLDPAAQASINAQALAEGQAEIEKLADISESAPSLKQPLSSEEIQGAETQMAETVQQDPTQIDDNTPLDSARDFTIDAPAEDELASFTTSSKKKNMKKKNKRASAFDFDEESGASASAEVPAATAIAEDLPVAPLDDTVNIDTPATDDVDGVDNDWPAFTSKKEKKKKKRASTFDLGEAEPEGVSAPPAEPSTVSAEVTEVLGATDKSTRDANFAEPSSFGDNTEPAAPAEDDWPSFSSKKDKKKKKRASAFDFTEEEPETPQEDITATLTEHVTPYSDEVQMVEDPDWDLGLTSKERKRKRKDLESAGQWPPMIVKPRAKREEAIADDTVGIEQERDADFIPTLGQEPTSVPDVDESAEPEMVQDDDWDFGLSSKERKKKRKELELAKNWPPMKAKEVSSPVLVEDSVVKEDTAEVFDNEAAERYQAEDLLPESTEREQPAADIDMIEDLDWDFGLSSKESKRKKKAMQSAGQWPPMKPREESSPREFEEANVDDHVAPAVEVEATERDIQDSQPAFDDQDQPSGEVEMVEDLEWDLGLSSKERKRKKKDLESAGQWPPMRPKELADSTALDEKLTPDVPPTTEDISETPMPEAVEPSEMVEDLDWDIGLSSKERKRKKKDLESAGNWPPMIPKPVDPENETAGRSTDLDKNEASLEPFHQDTTGLAMSQKRYAEEPIGADRQQALVSLVEELERRKATSEPEGANIARDTDLDQPADGLAPVSSTPYDANQDTRSPEQAIEIVPESAAVAEAQREDDEWAVPMKKSKKDRKKSKRTPTFDYLDEPDALISTSTPEPEQIQPSTPTALVVPETTDNVAMNESAVLASEPAETAEQPEQDEWAVPSKKSKKDKKKAKRSSTFDVFDEPESSTVMAIPTASTDEPSIGDAAVEPSDHALDDTVPSAIDAEQDVLDEVDTKENDVNDEWSIPTSGKKSKKDKKKHTPTVDLDEPLTPSDQLQDPEAAVVPDPTIVDSHSNEREADADSELLMTDEPKAVRTEENYGFTSTKKSKKDKKKTRASAFDFDETVTPSEAIPDLAEPADDTAAIETTDTVKEIPLDEPVDQLEEPTIGTATPADEPDEWAFGTAKKSKKDKKKKKASTFDFDDAPTVSDTALDTPTRLEDSPAREAALAEATAIEVASVETPKATEEPDEWAFGTSKKSKKDEKKRASTFDFDNATIAPEATHDTVAASDETPSMDAPLLEDTILESIPTEATAAAEGPEEWSFDTGKKSKKDKKKKRATTFDFDEPAETTTEEPRDISTQQEDSYQPELDIATKSPVDETPGQESQLLEEPITVSRAALDSAIAQEPVSLLANEPQPEDDWAFPVSSKKSKKDKKQKNSTNDYFAVASAMAAAAMGAEPYVHDSAKDSTTVDEPFSKDPEPMNIDEPENQAPISLNEPPSEDVWDVPGKKSKKDNKKKRGSAFVLDDDYTARPDDTLPREAQDGDAPRTFDPADQREDDVVRTTGQLEQTPTPSDAKAFELEKPREIADDSPSADNQTVSEPQMIEDLDWDIGLSSKERKKREKQLRSSGQWPPMKMSDAQIDVDDFNELLEDTTVMLAEDQESQVEMVEDDDWDLGLSSKERKRKEKQLKLDGNWPPMKSSGRSSEGASFAVDEADVVDTPSEREVQAPIEVEPTSQLDAPAEMVEDDDWDLGLSSKERKRKEKQLKADGNWPPMKVSERPENDGSLVLDEPDVVGASREETQQEPLEATDREVEQVTQPYVPAEMIEDTDWDLGLSSKERKRKEKQLRAHGNWPPMKLAQISLAEEPVEQNELQEQSRNLQLGTDDWSVPEKQDKKSKKKKRGSAFDWTDDAPSSAMTSGNATPAAEIDQPAFTDAVAGASTLAAGPAALASMCSDEDKLRCDNDRELDLGEPEAAAAEPDDWALPTRKVSKKDKKKRKSIPGAFEESGSTTPATPMEFEPVASKAVEAAQPNKPGHTRERSLDEALDDVLLMDSLQRDDNVDGRDRWAFEDDFMSGEPSHRPGGEDVEMFAEPEEILQPTAIESERYIPAEEASIMPVAEYKGAAGAEEVPPPAEDDERNAPTSKRSKKDKRSKRQSTQDADSTGVNTPPLDSTHDGSLDRYEHDNYHDRYEPESRTYDKSTAEHDNLLPIAGAVAGAAGVAALASERNHDEDDFAPLSRKKSKKDKKKNRQTEFYEPSAEAGEDVEEEIPLEASRDLDLPDHDRHQRYREVSPVREALRDDRSESPRWRRNDNRQAEFYEPMDPSREDEPVSRDGGVVDEMRHERHGSPSPAIEMNYGRRRSRSPVDETRYERQRSRSLINETRYARQRSRSPGGEMRHDRQKSRSPVDETRYDRQRSRSPEELAHERRRSRSPVAEPSPEADPDDVWGFKPPKSSEKDKKKKRESQYSDDNTTYDLVAPRAIPYALSGDTNIDFVPTPPPAIVDAGRRDYSSRSPRDAEHDVLREYEDEPKSGLTRQDTQQEVDDWYTSTSRSKKGKATKDGSGVQRADTVDTIAAMYGDDRVEKSRSVQDDEQSWDSGRKKSKKDKKRSKTPIVWEEEQEDRPRTRDSQDQDWYSENASNRSPNSKRAVFDHDAPRRSSPTQAWSASATRAEPRDDTHYSDGSEISETTRERRRRRRMSPQQRDWDGPPDLPRDGALTPPPERNDILDTALGVAAAVGFGGNDRDKRATEHTHAAEAPAWSFANVAPARRDLQDTINRDSGVQFESPVVGTAEESVRDSGYGHGWDREDHRGHLRPGRPQSPTSSSEDVRHRSVQDHETPARHHRLHSPDPVEPTTKDRSSVVFNSSPAVRSTPHTPHIDTSARRASPADLHQSPSIHSHRRSQDELLRRSAGSPLASNLIDRANTSGIDRAVFSPNSSSHPLSPPKSPLHSIPEDGPHPHTDDLMKGAAIAGIGALGAAALMSARDSPSPNPRSLRRSTSSLRNLRGNVSSPVDNHEADSSLRSRPIAGDHAGDAGASNRGMAEFVSHSH